LGRLWDCGDPKIVVDETRLGFVQAFDSLRAKALQQFPAWQRGQSADHARNEAWQRYAEGAATGTTKESTARLDDRNPALAI
jgi:hypothetical protein